MKIFKKLFTVTLAVILLVSFCACAEETVKPVSVEGTYTGCWVFGEDGSVSHDPNPYVYKSDREYGTYTQSGDKVIISWNNGLEVTARSTEKGFTYKGETFQKVNMENLYSSFSGYYRNYDNLWSNGSFDALSFTENGRLVPGQTGAYVSYSLEPITKTHGKVLTEVHSSNSAFDGLGYVNGGEPLGLIYYSEIDGVFHLRVSEGEHYYTDANGVKSRHYPWGIAHGHFIDWTEQGDTFSTLDVFDKLAGSGGTTAVPVSKTYTGDGASLTLYNDGELQLTRLDNSFQEVTTKTFMGGKAKFNNGATEINATYNFIATSNKVGKIFIDMSEKPITYYSDLISTGRIDPQRWVVGDYLINKNEITLKFTYKGITYNLKLS